MKEREIEGRGGKEDRKGEKKDLAVGHTTAKLLATSLRRLQRWIFLGLG